MVWVAGDRLFYLVGYLRPKEAEAVVASLR